MIRITKHTDYALVLLTHLVSQEEGSRFSARELAQVTQLPVPMVGKILKILHQKKLLGSKRGANGGYFLDRSPEKITLTEIIEAVEGPIAITDCSCSGDKCEFTSTCQITGNIRLINEAIRSMLMTISLKRMAVPMARAEFKNLISSMQSGTMTATQ